MQVFLGNYPAADDNGTEYQQQKKAIVAAINTYGTDHIAGVTVGNEFMLKSVHRFHISTSRALSLIPFWIQLSKREWRY
jgi:exo-beta-1,3-glucanase (GH17 family)